MMMTSRFWGIIIVVEFLEVIDFVNEFKSSALLSVDIILKEYYFLK